MERDRARQILRLVDQGVAFRFCNGREARTIYQLLEGIASLNSEQYSHHVYMDHNDFSNWLIDIIGDEKAALDIYSADQKKTLILLKGRILYCKHKAE